ncbi:hypothetical protein BU26DRAFT_178018 [Trematosphaeria pertusa]|uniref:Uncharacterized protein n=1 Tax=Trematosphaeria pertusa TaxID=390896 RepID=A0A6A6HUI3_9PLEO|nr:uncharacterized protein BU26DRAFT_178018 [Trematosphaeria pertusa]KAF2241432.1 hypothetical protein BU26DRAFT_178018 [Trematosphaeria pertusa]
MVCRLQAEGVADSPQRRFSLRLVQYARCTIVLECRSSRRPRRHLTQSLPASRTLLDRLLDRFPLRPVLQTVETTAPHLLRTPSRSRASIILPATTTASPSTSYNRTEAPPYPAARRSIPYPTSHDDSFAEHYITRLPSRTPIHTSMGTQRAGSPPRRPIRRRRIPQTASCPISYASFEAHQKHSLSHSPSLATFDLALRDRRLRSCPRTVEAFHIR